MLFDKKTTKIDYFVKGTPYAFLLKKKKQEKMLKFYAHKNLLVFNRKA